jgi:hypothetical protein
MKIFPREVNKYFPRIFQTAIKLRRENYTDKFSSSNWRALRPFYIQIIYIVQPLSRPRYRWFTFLKQLYIALNQFQKQQNNQRLHLCQYFKIIGQGQNNLFLQSCLVVYNYLALPNHSVGVSRAMEFIYRDWIRANPHLHISNFDICVSNAE